MKTASVYKDKIALHFLRSIALILITWDHLVPGMYIENKVQIPVSFVQKFIIWPLSIIQYFGFFGVVIFFLISGYATLLAYNLKRPSMIHFIIKRLFRILPPVLFSAFGYYFAYNILRALGVYASGVLSSPGGYFRANGPLWTLRIEIIFMGIGLVQQSTRCSDGP